MATPTASSDFGSSNGPTLDPPPERRRYTRRSMPAPPLPLPSFVGGGEGAPAIPCEVCEMKVPVFYCVNCDGNFCDRCWAKERAHKPGKLGPDGWPHEKAEVNVVNRLKKTFNPPSDPESQSRMHIEDEDSTWFGIGRDGANRPIFQDYGRYPTLMANSATGEHALRYPQLVSFIGQTGAGKSTLVKMLIEKQSYHSGLQTTNSMFPCPIVGSVKNDNVPTSGDVHLYADPTTFLSPLPMLYADCEGLEGGENLPIGARYRDVESQSRSKGSDSNPDQSRQRGRRWRIARETQRDISWANSPETQKRQYAVTELYPRILYTFSDVIVFVLQNPKTFESSVLSKLLDWASAAIEKSTNQPVLPHAIIVLNSTDLGVDQNEWEVDFATNILLSNVAETVNRDPRYRSYVNYWAAQGKQVHTMQELLECYYSSIRVVRIPRKGRYMLLEEQVGKLQQKIFSACNQSYETKRSCRMLSNSEELQVYLQTAFSHFCQNLDRPFNFIEVAIKNNPIPLDFGGNILKLAKAMRDTMEHVDAFKLFGTLSKMVASCIMLDCARHALKGPAEELLEKYYLEYCDYALDDFCGLFWRCEFANRQGRCVNVREGHTKGHQNDKGKIICSGNYISKFSWDTFHEQWFISLLEDIRHMQNIIAAQSPRHPHLAEKELVSNEHRINIQEFYRRLGGARNFVSHSTCFCCLREMPEHPLHCGHVLCGPCVYAYGTSGLRHVIKLDKCPLHWQDFKFPIPWTLTFKPELAGVRILCLDGGGIRGIVELEVLHAIESYLGGKIPIQNFFDLIVGTSTGGIIAMGLGVEQWSVSKCIEHFTRLTDKAFTPRWPPLPRLGRRYKTGPLEEALKDTFHDEYFFGGEHEEPSNIKVAITATSETGQSPVIFTNYNRQVETQPSYTFVRPDDVGAELKLWEVLRATSAAPGYFKTFVNSTTKQGYLDGALYNNNPTRVAYHESKLLWPDVEDNHPDILLSLGTGHNGLETSGTAEPQFGHRKRADINSDIIVIPGPRDRDLGIAAWFKKNEFVQNLNIMVRRVDNLLNSEQMWLNFRNDVLSSRDSEDDKRRYQRINPKIGFKVPALDDKRQTETLQVAVKSKLRQEMQYRKSIAKVAHRLVASSFYFERLQLPKLRGTDYITQGKIRCRFENGNGSLRALGSFMRNHQRDFEAGNFQPYFRIQEQHRERRHAVNKVIDASVIENMITRSNFNMEEFEIKVSDRHGDILISLALLDVSSKPELFPISGFPRSLILDALRSSSPSPSEDNRDSPKVGARRRRMRAETSHRQLEEERPLSIFDAASDQTEPISPPIRPPQTPKLFKPKSWRANDWIYRRAGLGIDHDSVQDLSVNPTASDLTGNPSGPINISEQSISNLSMPSQAQSPSLIAPSSPPNQVPRPSTLSPLLPQLVQPPLWSEPHAHLAVASYSSNARLQQPPELSVERQQDLDEDESALAEAVEESLRINYNRWTANGTNLEELAQAIENSKIETRGVYYQLE